MVAFERLVGCIFLFVTHSLALILCSFFVGWRVCIKLNHNKLLMFAHFWQWWQCRAIQPYFVQEQRVTVGQETVTRLQTIPIKEMAIEFNLVVPSYPDTNIQGGPHSWANEMPGVGEGHVHQASCFLFLGSESWGFLSTRESKALERKSALWCFIQQIFMRNE